MKQQNAPALQESKEAQIQLDSMLLACFSVQKMYGRQPENIEIINQVFHNILGRFQGNKVIKAFEKWMERSQEFPTPADIVNLIKRNGRPPLSESLFVTISKKDYEDRTEEERQYMRDYQAEMHDEWEVPPDPIMQSARIGENEKLRSKIYQLEEENKRLTYLLHETRMAKGIEKPRPTHQERIDNTIKYMKSVGSSEEDISDFLASQLNGANHIVGNVIA